MWIIHISKSAEVDRKSPEELDHAIRQILSRAVISDEVIDIFKAAGLKKPDISVLSDEFLAEVKGLPHKNLAVETLKKLLQGEIKKRGKRNIVGPLQRCWRRLCGGIRTGLLRQYR